MVDDPVFERFRAILSGSADDDIVRAEARLRAAQLAADNTVLEELLADDLLFTGPDGEFLTKAEDLAAYAAGAIRIISHEPESLHVRSAGADAVVCVLRARLAVEVGDDVVRGMYQYTRVWRRGAAGWQVIGGHVSEVLPATGTMSQLRQSSMTAMAYTILIFATMAGHSLG